MTKLQLQRLLLQDHRRRGALGVECGFDLGVGVGQAARAALVPAAHALVDHNEAGLRGHGLGGHLGLGPGHGEVESLVEALDLSRVRVAGAGAAPAAGGVETGRL